MHKISQVITCAHILWFCCKCASSHQFTGFSAAIVCVEDKPSMVKTFHQHHSHWWNPFSGTDATAIMLFLQKMFLDTHQSVPNTYEHLHLHCKTHTYVHTHTCTWICVPAYMYTYALNLNVTWKYPHPIPLPPYTYTEKSSPKILHCTGKLHLLSST